jgi:calcium/calmodulin-dependent protein kinase I
MSQQPRPSSSSRPRIADPNVDPTYLEYLEKRRTKTAQQQTHVVAEQEPEYSEEHPSEEHLPRDTLGEIAVYGTEDGLATYGPVNWDQFYGTWDRIGKEYREPIPNGLPLTPTQLLNTKGFTFLNQLGSGSFGTVWRVRATHLIKDLQNNYVVTELACKVLSLFQYEQNRSVKEAMEALMRESDIHSQLNHPNIIKSENIFHIMDTTSGFPQPIRILHFMELCNGDLSTLIYSPPEYRMSEYECHKWFVQIAEGLRYLHDRNIVHFDIKPQNILYLVTSINDRIFKLTDFGASRKFANTRAIMAGTRGTRKYMAPDMTSGARWYESKPIDIYSFGITLAEAICGRVQLPMGAPQTTIRDILNAAQNWAQSSGCNYGMSQHFADLLTSMTRTDPKTRTTIQQVCTHVWVTTNQ